MARKVYHGQVRSGDRPGAEGRRYQAFVHEGTKHMIGQPYLVITARRVAPGLFDKADFMVEHALKRLPDGVSFEVVLAMLQGEIHGVADAWTAGGTKEATKVAKLVAPEDTGALKEEIQGVYPAKRGSSSGGSTRCRDERGRFIPC